MNRRGFLGRVIGAVVAAKVAPKVIETPKPAAALLFHKDAFALTMAPLKLREEYDPATYTGTVVRVRLPQRFR